MLFDEPIDVRRAEARFESRAKLAGLRTGDRGRDLVVMLVEPLAASDVLRVEGVACSGGLLALRRARGAARRALTQRASS